jgi:hypothetical protein
MISNQAFLIIIYINIKVLKKTVSKFRFFFNIQTELKQLKEKTKKKSPVNRGFFIIHLFIFHF